MATQTPLDCAIEQVGQHLKTATETGGAAPIRTSQELAQLLISLLEARDLMQRTVSKATEKSQAQEL